MIERQFRVARVHQFLGVALAAALPALALAAGSEEWTPKHVMKIRQVRSAKISPDGKHIAYTLSVPRPVGTDNDGGAWSRLHVVDLDGNSRSFIGGEVNVGSVEWTPDGKAISFTARRGDDEHSALYEIPVDGGEARKILEHETGVGSYEWHADGEQVVFVSTDKKPEDAEKNEKRGLKAEVYEEDWRFPRVWIATVNRDADDGGDDDKDEDENEPRQLEIEGAARSPHWSPDGSKLLISVAPTPSIDDEYMFSRLRIVDAESGKELVAVKNPGKLGPAAWSPDGKHIAFNSAGDLNDPSTGRLMVADATTGEFENILPNLEGHLGSFAWENNKTIKYVADIGVQTMFGEVDLDGSNNKTLVSTDSPIVLTSMDLAKKQPVAAFVGQSPEHPAEVFALKHGESQPRRLTTSNPWLSDMQMAKQEAVEYKARDGVMIQGILVRPMNEQPNKRYPLILAVHGGPEAHVANRWVTRYSDPGQLGAQRGFAIFYPNYRGSTGRGVEFSKMDQHDYAGAEFNDLVDAITHFDKAGLVDPKRVGVTGGSYGGFATAWCSTALSEHFAAGVMFVGISDHVSKAGTTDIPLEMMLVHARAWPWDEWDFFRERSPITYVKQAKTPLLILHGKEDTRVHPSQSMELFRYLKVIGQVPVRLVLYPGEGHGNRKIGAQYDYNLRLMRWMEHYLMGEGGDAPEYELDYELKSDEDEEEDGEEK